MPSFTRCSGDRGVFPVMTGSNSSSRLISESDSESISAHACLLTRRKHFLTGFGTCTSSENTVCLVFSSWTATASAHVSCFTVLCAADVEDNTCEAAAEDDACATTADMLACILVFGIC